MKSCFKDIKKMFYVNSLGTTSKGILTKFSSVNNYKSENVPCQQVRGQFKIAKILFRYQLSSGARGTT